MKMHQNISRESSILVLFGLFLIFNFQPVFADFASDEDELFFEELVRPSFRLFHKKNKRFPQNWLELGIQDSCTGYSTSERKHFPKASEAIIWTPQHCQLSYKLVFSGTNSFRIVALAKGHVVSVFENFRAIYYPTSYHDHHPNYGNGQD